MIVNWLHLRAAPTAVYLAPRVGLEGAVAGSIIADELRPHARPHEDAQIDWKIQSRG